MINIFQTIMILIILAILLNGILIKILLNEFSIPSISNVKIKGLSTGGDFDIFFLLLGKLSYLEIKSSPPNNISIEEIENFIKRVDIIKSICFYFIYRYNFKYKKKYN